MMEFLTLNHARAGIAAIFSFLLVFVELISPQEKPGRRIKIFVTLATFFLIVSWILGGYLYINFYGPQVKPVIKAGPTAWVHSLIMETKEHLFLFLPPLATLLLAMVFSAPAKLIENRRFRLALQVLAALIIFVGLMIVGMGHLISVAARAGAS